MVKKTKTYDSYLLAYDSFSFDLRTVRELNRALSKSIDDFRAHQEASLIKRISKLDVKQQQEALKIKNAFLAFMKSKDETFEYETKNGLETITNDYFINGILLPEQFTSFVRNMSLVYLIVEFENFIKEVLEVTFRQKPEILRSCQKSLTFEDLMLCQNLETAKQEIINKEIFEIMNKGILETGKYFEKVLKLKIKSYVDWQKFIERFYRRNILVHNQGMPTREYRNATGYNRRAGYMKVTEKYLTETIDLFGAVAKSVTDDLRKKFL